MDRTRVISGALIASAALIALLITYWYVFIYQPGRISHDDFVRPDTAIRLQLQPAKIQWYVTKLAPGITKYIDSIPKFTSTQSFSGSIEWVHAMPYEISMLYHHGTAETLNATLFINTHPNDPDFGKMLTNVGFFREIGWVDWGRDGFERDTDSSVSASGIVNIDYETQRTIAQTWSSSGNMAPPKMAGAHFIEFAADNSGGALLSVHRALMRSSGRISGREINSYLLSRWRYVQRVHVWADLLEDDLVRFNAEVECTDGLGASQVEEGMGFLAAEIAYDFGNMGFSFEGSAHVEGTTVRGEYEFYGFEEKLRRALGS